jgi:5-(aminomethyl)-3-furanmethanol phosphate kinase
MMNLDAVIKVGGSLSRGDALEALCRKISHLGEHHRLVVVPGGGQFADQVRNAYRQYNLDETTAHHMALLAMDQYGYLLNQLIAGSSLQADLTSACESAGLGQVAILLPSHPVFLTDPLPHSWQVTSDAIAAWVAQQTNSQRLILLKDVDGLFISGDMLNTSAGMILEMTVDQLAGHSGGVDEYLSRLLALTPLETWVLNGSHPSRLSELLNTGYTAGTRIRCS